MSRRGGGRQPYSGRDQPSPAAGQSSSRGRGRGRGRGGGRYGPAGSGRGRGSYSGAGDSGLSTTSHPSASSVPSSSTVPPRVSQPVSATVSSLSEQVEKKLTVKPAAPTPDPVPAQSQAPGPVVTVPPASSKAVRIPVRPGFGTLGRKIVVRANHFLVQVAEMDIHHYDVSITPEVTSKKVNREVMTKLAGMYRDSHLGKRIPAYDGRKSIYTAGPLPFESKEFVVNLEDKADSGSSSARARKERKFKVVIKFASKPDLFTLQQFLCSSHLEAPQEIIQVLDVVLRAAPSEKHTVVGRSFFSQSLGVKGDLGDGIEYWRGYYQSLRPTQMGLSLNIDVSARSFYEPILVTEFVAKHFHIRDFSRALSDTIRLKVRKALRGLKVQLSHLGYVKSHKITGLSLQPLGQLKFTADDNATKISVVDYFRDKYKIALRYKALPAIQAGTDQRPIYLPMELCRICEGQRYTKKLNERQVTALLRATCQRPSEREASIKKTVKLNEFNTSDLVRDEFGMEVGSDLALVDARILPPPMLKYHDTGREARVNPDLGQWNMINKKLVNGARVDFWSCVGFSMRMNENLQFQFFDELINMCNSKGMEFNPNPIVPISLADPRQLENALLDIHKQSKSAISRLGDEKSLQLLIIILPDESGSYGKIKRICETELGIVTQCCQPRMASRLSKQYLENVSLKINVKVGGRNTVLDAAVHRRIPLLTDVPTIIFGADVTHPQPGEDSSPSIAAVVASMDWPEVTKYRGLVSAQSHREEIIQDLFISNDNNPQKQGMIRELLVKFYRSTGEKPYRIIFYRDGVSEGQFSQVLLHEMDAIRKACCSLQEGYMPRVTFVVVQKRHHTRLFPADHKSRNQTDKSGNIQPGTVVDTKICHPTEFDFYLNSHAGIQGTSRPSHYHVLYDENNFTADQLQLLTYSLCYTYARCTRSVSIVPPAYYAHLAAFRARYYIEGDMSDSGSSSGPRSGGVGSSFRALPVIKENVADVMFYC